MPPKAETPPSGQPKEPKQHPTWNRIRGKANTIASISALFVALMIVGGVIGYLYSQTKKTPQAPKTTIETLSPDDLKKLTELGANLGTAGQILNIGADTLFRGKVDIGSDLSITGRLNANGPVTLSQLNITGTTAATGLNVGSNLIVSGTTTMQRGLTVQELVTINGGLTVSGATSLNTLNASTIAVRNISISGPLTISHLVTQGAAPTIAANSVGGGGTVSISGNDTAGTININTGSGPGNVLATITFRAAFTSTTHVQITPLTSGAAAAQVYITRSATGFQIHANTPPAGQTLSFDYLVAQ